MIKLTYCYSVIKIPLLAEAILTAYVIFWRAGLKMAYWEDFILADNQFHSENAPV